jgi:hypothetical protein
MLVSSSSTPISHLKNGWHISDTSASNLHALYTDQCIRPFTLHRDAFWHEPDGTGDAGVMQNDLLMMGLIGLGANEAFGYDRHLRIVPMRQKSSVEVYYRPLHRPLIGRSCQNAGM